MSNPWIDHVKDFAKKHNVSYKEAVSNSKCQSEYKKKKVGSGLKLGKVGRKIKDFVVD